ncbi:hypothetical protein BTA51_20100 [Hahella sp. CCB-MM4]|uniref:DUF1614 domain-containing protein n=1 Tax=Hahella sp. (strain CCB-MM4) TaxID=1926491 RepID=UPI000B9AFADC|nr:DUF1614 domain-containing protein [Hahella sp. CCB-MM4]OZG71587.1 hypothetical protein BTA51_20100 [Hahella sp. CCB-MM4]
MPLGLFPFIVLLLLFLLPFLFLDIMTIALGKLGIDPLLAPWVVFFMFVGSLLNIPVLRESVEQPLTRHLLDVWRAERYLPQLERQVTERIIAVNVGGFVIPMLLVVYEIMRIIAAGPEVLLPLVTAVVVNVAVCFWSARPVENVGVVMPTFVPGPVAALTALFLAPDMAPPVAFCAGVLGPVIGADLMNLNKIRKVQVGVASIGGAGTFDGIVISGLLAVLLT